MEELNRRGHALEDAFFKQRDNELLAKLRADVEGQDHRSALRTVSQIDDDATLDLLVAHQITPETWTSISLIPLVAVAWADGKMDEKERLAVLRSAHESGVAEGTIAHHLLEDWLANKPDDGLLKSWEGYVKELKTKIGETELDQLKKSVMGRARLIAEATGGYLGFINAIAPSEEKVLKELEETFG